ncbi:MAG: alpha/beta hydrolase [Rhodospirillales bacterium]|nr:alpha/beta hydrolase [Rhodospirillales bacterium]MDH3790539.1 alpha/beta hydrolase [Rhodospirillales bacterium]MDH3912460.1 alpha/beta hydrolase [Rhodospirillales bacterium]MDH3919101.1 alpha/beta hydrolase [Rhodospirillales bacterium]MDH3967752.1 alpha/beta hydrolase [Rhodospirillales bacterium]
MTGPVPLALLPGLLCDGALWRAQIEGLAGLADCRVADFTEQDSVAAMAASVLATTPDRFALAGLSMGGYVAFELLRQAPGRVTRLALLDTSARADTPEQTRRRRGLIELARKGKFRGVPRRLLPLLVHPARLEEAELPTAITAMAERIGRDAFLRQQEAIMGRPDSRPDLVRIACPTLVLCGRQDALTPLVRHTEMAAGIARSRLVVIEDCGHLAPMERPAAVTAALADWLATD